jgi:hypothetical protein
MSKFDSGRLVATPGAISFCENHAVNMAALLRRHLSGDWGDMDAEDKATNNAALASGEDRIFSSYNVGDHDKVWIITEWDRSVTTILLPEDY